MRFLLIFVILAAINLISSYDADQDILDELLQDAQDFQDLQGSESEIMGELPDLNENEGEIDLKAPRGSSKLKKPSSLNKHSSSTSTSPKSEINFGNKESTDDFRRANGERKKLNSLKMSKFQYLGSHDETLAKIKDQQLLDSIRNEKDEKRRSYLIPRKYAKPVEDIIEKYNAHVEYSDFYGILGMKFGENFSMYELKKKYRTIALIVHPDKNPHPDAGLAFDALQDAYNVLSSEEERKRHESHVIKIKKSRKLTFKKIRTKLSNLWFNTKSKWLLFIHRVKNNQWQEEQKELIESIQRVVQKLNDFYQHFMLLPTYEDKLLLLSEKMLRNKLLIGTTVGFLLLLVVIIRK